MTEGIIQKVFKKYRLFEYYNRPSFYAMEQELIAEIKNKCKQQENDFEEYPDMLSRYDLIGDDDSVTK